MRLTHSMTQTIQPPVAVKTLKRRRKGERLSKDASIVICGCGLAGLSVALSLEQAGYTNVAIIERDASFAVQKEGYGLTLSYNYPKGPLAKLGLLERVAQHDCPSRSHYVFDSSGKVLGYFGNAFLEGRGSGQRGNLRVPRNVLRKILLDSLKHTTIMWGHQLVNWEQAMSTRSMEDVATNCYKLTIQRDGSEETILNNVNLLVAADGIRSSIVRMIYERHCKPILQKRGLEMGLSFMGVRLIYGLADFEHPLLDERGFYSLDGTHRLFTMPFQSNKFGATPRRNRIMWQLSFRTTDAEQSASLQPKDLLADVLRRTQQWHDPVQSMIRSTPLGTVWGTDLQDRDPQELHKLVLNHKYERLVVVGDALHSMSPFKGQGANQALQDGPLLASWLSRASPEAAARNTFREIVQRTALVVKASREAAKQLHSPGVLNNGTAPEAHSRFAGVQDEHAAKLLQTLHSRSICAALGKDLDPQVKSVIAEMDIGEKDTSDPFHGMKADMIQSLREKAISFSREGDIQSLRLLSLKKGGSEVIRSAVDAGGGTCVHIGAKLGNLALVKWLVREVQCSLTAADSNGLTPIGVAVDTKMTAFLEKLADS